MVDSTSNNKPPKSEFFILGLTSDGKQFRPSDWSERLSGAMSCFRPDSGRQSHLHYSLFVQPILINGIRSVVVDHALREIEPLAYHFVLDFAKDNDLQIIDACLIPETPAQPAKPV
ncbi:DUF3579 domain-containing protein [Solimicrobium silvestre]|uniref:DUF3579 domain-containing protein n=1 Tax=Solimicrobium silvestre TaxID=2099400 RepID=A0A2S9H4U8_9BURK|nr:DUF3579 domain-containing protein [Solimicrobium silvestre]PRC94988.1 hypothetical protein S2091_0183 [Solimicrobium silvestre]